MIDNPASETMHLIAAFFSGFLGFLLLVWIIYEAFALIRHIRNRKT